MTFHLFHFGCHYQGETEETEEDAEPTNSASDAAPANLAEEV